MKKLLLFAIAIISLAACKTAVKDSTISGTFTGGTAADTLYAYVQDADSLITIQTDAEGKFNFTVAPDSTEKVQCLIFWKHGDDQSASGAAAISQKAGHDVEMAVELVSREGEEMPTMEVTFTGDLADRLTYENLTYQYLSVRPDFTDNSGITTYSELLQHLTAGFDDMRAALQKTDDADYIAEETKTLAELQRGLEWDWASACEQAGNTLLGDADFMKMADSVDLNDTTQIKDIQGYVNWYVVAHSDDYQPLTPVAAKMRMIREMSTSQDIRNRVAENAMTTQMFFFAYGMSPTEPELESFYEEYLQTTTDTTYTNFCKEQLQAISQSAPGQAAISFTVVDEKGTEHDFADLVKGQVTYIDFWATWCGPCCKEIPHLAKLAESYKGDKGVRIISISLDQDAEAWHKKIAADKPIWEQYLIPDVQNCPGLSGYSINSIPRFMLFDKDGNLVRTSAPRPSEKEIRTLIDSLK